MLLLGVLVVFYLCTAVIRGDGPGEELVFAPFHGLNPFFSHREGGVWDGGRSPGSYVRLLYTCYETSPAPWLMVYVAGCFVALPVLALSVTAMEWRRARGKRINVLAALTDKVFPAD